MQTKIVKLKPPPLITKDNFLGAQFGLRPTRKDGIRIEREDFLKSKKIIYHNYGHGGAGISLGYSSVKYSVSQFFHQQGRNPNKSIAVLGSGYIGLFTAIMLAEGGYSVHVYADNFPQKNAIYKEGQPLPITSQVAAGLWQPFCEFVNKPLYMLFSAETFHYYSKWIKEGRYKGISFKKIYNFNDIYHPFDFCTPKGLIESTKLKIDFGNGVLHSSLEHESIVMEGDVWLHELMADAKSKGVEFQSKRFDTKEDVLALKEPIIFNCTGLGSKKLLNDDNFQVTAGHLIFTKPCEGVDYFFSAMALDGKNEIATYPHRDKYCFGYMSEEIEDLKEPKKETVDKIIQLHNEWIKEKCLPRSKL